MRIRWRRQTPERNGPVWGHKRVDVVALPTGMALASPQSHVTYSTVGEPARCLSRDGRPQRGSHGTDTAPAPGCGCGWWAGRADGGVVAHVRLDGRILDAGDGWLGEYQTVERLHLRAMCQRCGGRPTRPRLLLRRRHVPAATVEAFCRRWGMPRQPDGPEPLFRGQGICLDHHEPDRHWAAETLEIVDADELADRLRTDVVWGRP